MIVQRIFPKDQYTYKVESCTMSKLTRVWERVLKTNALGQPIFKNGGGHAPGKRIVPPLNDVIAG